MSANYCVHYSGLAMQSRNLLNEEETPARQEAP